MLFISSKKIDLIMDYLIIINRAYLFSIYKPLQLVLANSDQLSPVTTQ